MRCKVKVVSATPNNEGHVELKLVAARLRREDPEHTWGIHGTRMNMWIDFANAPQVGSCFWLDLQPAAAEPEEVIPDPDQPAELPRATVVSGTIDS